MQYLPNSSNIDNQGSGRQDLEQDSAQDVLLYPMRTKHDCGMASGFHWEDDPRPLGSPIAEHDHCLLYSLAKSCATKDNGKKIHGGKLTVDIPRR